MIREFVGVAREVEMDTFKKGRAYGNGPIEECWEETGKGPVGVQRVDTNTGGAEKPEYSCSLDVKEIKKDKREDLFAAPPLSAAKTRLFSLGASVPGSCLDSGDVARAYFHPRARRRVCVKLSIEDFHEFASAGC